MVGTREAEIHSLLLWEAVGAEGRTWRKCVHKDVGVLGLHPGWAVFGDVWRGFIWANVLPQRSVE